ncbi:drug/metabolite transporter (DMT)-like permease [Aequitasia blattaphilus]|uniref:DMT family transporter n=1 Tax=Aequitasia blattaphilus TaxID=2949332 RepID=A0ABT1E6V0_9FIRM|nr:DMT family transporter [Aequitasia blattaphilus]MCP1101493.1 DMT family transporter [Aequitasia blattaphilus]MCR8614133.1 DMT family transporter [Aequitasia blattaphilus]
MDKKILGHSFALVTGIIWGVTFISTKILLIPFKPIEVLFLRFVIGFFALLILRPKKLGFTGFKRELLFASAGLTGVTFYFLCENIALTYTQASNVGVIVSIAPLFTVVLSRFFMKEERLSPAFITGLVAAMTGVCLISINGARLSLNPKGDLLAVGAAIVWSFYSLLSKKISNYGYHTILSTRRIFLYGVIFMVPFLPLFKFSPDIAQLKNPLYLFNLLFLGLLASAICYVTWNYAIKILGPVKTSVYIYIVPLVSVITSVLILGEQVTLLSIAGTVLTLIGLLISEQPFKKIAKNN